MQRAKCWRSVFLLAILGMAGCSRSAETNEVELVVPVDVQVVQTETVLATATHTAILEAYRAVDIMSEVAGTVGSIARDVGDRVKTDAILASLEKEVAREQLVQAEAAHLAAGARSRVATRDFARDSTLFAAGDIAAAIYEASRMTAETSRADLMAATATRDLSRRQLRETDIRAPFAGVVARRHTELGAYVTPGVALFRVVAIDSLRLVLGVSQRNVTRVRPGMEVIVETEAPGETFYHGRVRRIAPEADDLTRTFAVEVVIPNPPSRPLKDGMVVRATLVLETIADVIAVPKDVILHQNTDPHVFVVADSTARKRPVTIGRLIGSRVIVHGGLQPGDRLVRSGMDNLRDGARISIEKSTTVLGGGA